MPSRRRAAEACTFCRRRKIKCNNERPECINCKTYGRECVYEPVSEDSKEAGRERHERVKRQQRLSQGRGSQERSRSHQSPAVNCDSGATVVSASPAPSVIAGDQDDGVAHDVSQQSLPPDAKPEASVSRILVWSNGLSSYHGRTSALFEDNAQEKSAPNDPHPRMPDDWVERGLVAEAARQRQLEELNFRQGKLDFDGVDPDLGMHLLSLHWNRQHHSFLITYRPAFMRDMACNGPYFSKLLLNAIYFGASKFSPRLEVRKDPDDVRTAGWSYRQRVRELLGSSLDKSDVTTIQALLQMTNSLFALGDERSAAWLYSGLAFRMLIDMGLHVDAKSTRRFTDEDLEIRRRVFWGAFVVDKIQSLYQGRPVTLKDSDALVPIQFLDTYEELEHWQPFAYGSSSTDYPGSAAYSISTFTYLCKLSITMSDILSCIYTERSSDKSPADLASMLDTLQRRLDGWRESLPSHLQFDPSTSKHNHFPPPHVFSLQAMYNVLIILLHRPFVADGHLYSTSRSISVDSFMKCATAASEITNLLRSYHRAFTIRRAPSLISYATYVAATIHTRIAAKRGSSSAAYANLLTCLAVFQGNQETNSAVKRAAMIVQGLMRKHGLVVDNVTSDALDVQQIQDSSNQQHDPTSSLEKKNRRIARTKQPLETANKTYQGQIGTPTITGGSDYSPASDWMDVDGIIQNFLQENSDVIRPGGLDDQASQGGSTRPSWSYPQAQPPPNTAGLNVPMAHQVIDRRLGEGGMNSPDVAFNELQWEQNWQLGESWPLMDPLFGLNGASSDYMRFTGW